MAKLIVDTTNFTEISEKENKIYYADTSVANTTPTSLDISQANRKGQRAAAQFNLNYKRLTPFTSPTTAVELFETLGVSLSIRFLPYALRDTKLTEIRSAVASLKAIIDDDEAMGILMNGGVDLSGLTIPATPSKK